MTPIEHEPGQAPCIPKRRIAILEDDDSVRRSLQLLLRGHNYDVKAYRSAASLLCDGAFDDIACLVADFRLVEADGIAVLEALRSRGWAAPALLLTAFASPDLRARATAAGYAVVLDKPLKSHMLVNAIDVLVRDS